MSEDEFTRLFNYITERFDRIDKSLETKADKAGVQKIYDILEVQLRILQVYVTPKELFLA